MAAREDPFTWGIVGTGAIARQFAGDLALLTGARIGAVHSRSERSGADFVAATGAVAKVHTDLEALLADPSLDAIYIASPNAAHAGQAIAAIEAGKPVLVEKPLATSSDDARAIAALAAARRCFAMEGMWSRFLPAVQAARALIRQGAIGEVTHIEGELAFERKEQAGDRFFDPALGGGASLDLGVYPLSLGIHLLGQPSEVSGRWWAAASGVDMRAEYRLRFGAATGLLSCGFDRNGANHLTVSGTQGAVRLHPPFLKAQRLTVYGKARDWPLVGAGAAGSGLVAKVLARLPVPGRRVEHFFFPGGGLQFEADAVMAAVRSGAAQSETMPLSESVAVLELIETILTRPPETSLRN